MRKITKRIGFEPQSLTDWKLTNPTGDYKDLSPVERVNIRYECLSEQFYLCAYCCNSITGLSGDCMNEHVVARKIAPHRSLDFTNIVASCTTLNQCDHAHDCHPLPLTPFDSNCETDLVFLLSGRVKGTTVDAQESLRVLNLDNNKLLIEHRKQLFQTVLLDNGIEEDDEDLIKEMIVNISSPNNGKLEAFSPVVVNVLKQWIA